MPKADMYLELDNIDPGLQDKHELRVQQWRGGRAGGAHPGQVCWPLIDNTQSIGHTSNAFL